MKIISVLETENYAVGVMGRCASTNMIKFLSGRKTREPWGQSFDYFNNECHKEKYLVLRDPEHRWKSAKNSGVPLDDYHALPYLRDINFGSISGIIPFEDIPEYIGEKRFPHNKGYNLAHNKVNPPQGLLDAEMVLYKLYRRNIPVLTPEKFKKISQETAMPVWEKDKKKWDI